MSEILIFCFFAGVPFFIIVWMNGLFGVRGGITATILIAVAIMALWFFYENNPGIGTGVISYILLPLAGLGTFFGFAYTINKSNKH